MTPLCTYSIPITHINNITMRRLEKLRRRQEPPSQDSCSTGSHPIVGSSNDPELAETEDSGGGGSSHTNDSDRVCAAKVFMTIVLLHYVFLGESQQI